MNTQTFNPPTKRTLPGIRSVFAGAALAIAASAPAFGKTDDFIVMDDEISAIQAFAVVELDNGDSVSFRALPDAKGETAGVLIVEKRSPGRKSIHALSELRDANALEIFKAIADPKDRVPGLLEELYRDSKHAEQGWARGDSLSGGNTYSTCPAAGQWSDNVEAFGNAFNHTPFKSTWDGPTTKPEHWKTIAGNGFGGLQNRELNGQANDVTAFYSEILYCVEDYENAATYNGNYIGNYVSSSFRLAGHQSWIPSGQTQLEDSGQSYSHTYSPANKFAPGATKYDFRVTITQAKPADEFHIGATWVYGGPSDYATKK